MYVQLVITDFSRRISLREPGFHHLTSVGKTGSWLFCDDASVVYMHLPFRQLHQQPEFSAQTYQLIGILASDWWIVWGACVSLKVPAEARLSDRIWWFTTFALVLVSFGWQRWAWQEWGGSGKSEVGLARVRWAWQEWGGHGMSEVVVSSGWHNWTGK